MHMQGTMTVMPTTYRHDRFQVHTGPEQLHHDGQACDRHDRGQVHTGPDQLHHDGQAYERPDLNRLVEATIIVSNGMHGARMVRYILNPTKCIMTVMPTKGTTGTG